VTMWSETDLDSEQFVSEHLLTGTNSRPKENGDYHHHSLDPVDPLMGPGGHNHLLRHEMLSDAMLGHVSSGDSGLASLATRDRDQETTLMIHTPLTLTKEAGAGDYQVHNSQYQLTNTEFKLPTRKEKEGILLRYARKLGLNDRGCYLAIGLALLAFLLLVVIIIMAACWPVTYLRHTGPVSVCSTPSCLESSSHIIGAMNTSHNPCSDMWSYACGGWLEKHSIPHSRSKWSLSLEIQQSVITEKSRLISMFSHEPSQYDSIEWKVQHFYESCKSLEYIEADREKPLLKIINNLGGWDVLRSFNLYSWDHHRVLRELHADHGVSAFFRVDVVSDWRRPGQNIIRVSPSGLGMPDKTFYQRFPNDSSIQAYQTFLKDSAQLFGAPSPDAAKFAIDMFNFEKRIAEITPDIEYMNNPVKVNNKMKVKELRVMSINIPWLEVLKACYPNAGIAEETEIIVVSPQYTADIAVIMSTTDRGSLNNYLVWKLVQKFMPYLSKAFTEVVDLYRKHLTGAQKPAQRWEFCADTTQMFFGHLMDSLLFQSQDRSLTQNRVSVVQRMFVGMREALRQRVSSSADLDYYARQAALDKLAAMTVQVGTPDILTDRKFLKIMYKDLSVQKTDFFQNMQYGMAFMRRREEHELVSPGEETRWLRNLLSDRVSFVPSANKVVVPEYLLRPPLFHPGYPYNVNLGGLGVRLAEAVVEGVLGTGSVFTASGRILDGQDTSNFTLSRMSFPHNSLERLSSCLGARWAAMRLDTPDHLDKCADSSAVSLAGLDTALAAMEEIVNTEGATLMPALERLDPQAVFFLQYSQSLCSMMTLQHRDLERATTTQLMGREKLAGLLSQFSQFQHYFFCSETESDNMCELGL